MAHALSSKICTSCKVEKPICNFGIRPEYKDGYRSQCNQCRSKSSLAYSRTEAGRHSLRTYRVKEKANRSPDGLRWSKLRTKYGITQEEYRNLLEKQDGCCAVCLSSDPKSHRGVFSVDHCHETGRVRGLLCSICNTAIGMLGDTLAGIEAAARYLRDASRL